MSLIRVRRNLGFLIAGAILFGVSVNVYYEINAGKTEYECRYTSIP